MRKRIDDEMKAGFMNRLKQALVRSGISQNELARRTRQSGQGVSDWLKRGAMPGGEAILRLPKALGVSANWLISNQGPELHADDTTETIASLVNRGRRAALLDVQGEVRRMLEELEKQASAPPRQR